MKKEREQELNQLETFINCFPSPFEGQQHYYSVTFFDSELVNAVNKSFFFFFFLCVQDVRQITEQWNFIPRVVEELAKLEGTRNESAAVSKEDLCRQVMECKQIYEVELKNLGDDPSKKKKPKTERQERDSGRTEAISSGTAGYDSDETIEMTEEEIDLAYKNVVASKIP